MTENPSFSTRSQQFAQRAYRAVSARFDPASSQGKSDPKKYLSFARAFPTLIHTCGLAQATAFALAKKGEQAAVLNDLAKVLAQTDGAQLHQASRGETKPGQPPPTLLDYLHLTREALAGASWLKRYSEALLDTEAAADSAASTAGGRAGS